MPVESKVQNAAMHAAAEGNSTLGIPQSVGKDFVDASAGQSIKSLPMRANQSKARKQSKAKALANRGLMSEKAMARFM